MFSPLSRDHPDRRVPEECPLTLPAQITQVAAARRNVPLRLSGGMSPYGFPHFFLTHVGGGAGMAVQINCSGGSTDRLRGHPGYPDLVGFHCHDETTCILSYLNCIWVTLHFYDHGIGFMGHGFRPPFYSSQPYGVPRNKEYRNESGVLQRFSWFRPALGDLCTQWAGRLVGPAGFPFVHCRNGCHRSNLAQESRDLFPTGPARDDRTWLELAELTVGVVRGHSSRPRRIG